MKKAIFLFFLMSLALLPLTASVYKGQKYFKKKCMSCHGKAFVFVTEKSYEEWERYLDSNGELLYKIHKDSREASSSMEYFNSKHYGKKLNHYSDFFLEYASDTGNIPACE